jgi:hypothetical protein
MKLFTCDHCQNLLYFENVVCTGCSAGLGFIPDAMHLAPLTAEGEGVHTTGGERHRYRMCANYRDHGVCNWLVPVAGEDEFCVACRLNETIPDLNVPGNKDRWQTLETEKRRLVYALLRLGLPVSPRSRDSAGLAFAFLGDTRPNTETPAEFPTGHADGLITINIAEADPSERERMREKMDEPYRTLLGHFRHESGHYYWDRLISDGGRLETFRKTFGDERQDYGQSLDQHYQQGPPTDWPQHFVSAYAGSHPWEDWAETWAHYLHMVDTLETASHFGLRIQPPAHAGEGHTMEADFDPYAQSDFQLLVDQWIPLTFALNSLNRSMGHGHAYPFVLAPGVIEKLAFVHGLIREVRPKR